MHKDRILHIKKRIALIAHDNKKKELIEWVQYNKDILGENKLYGTGTTGKMIEEATGLSVNRLNSGPLGGDLQIGSLIARGKIGMVFFFWDPMEAQPHDPDIKALLRICAVWNVPIANNRSTADFIITSPLFNKEYPLHIKSQTEYLDRHIPK